MSLENLVRCRAEDNIRVSTILECLEPIKSAIEKSDDVKACIKKLFYGIFSTSRLCYRNSTSEFSNAVNSAKLKGYFEVLEILLKMQSYDEQ